MTNLRVHQHILLRTCFALCFTIVCITSSYSQIVDLPCQTEDVAVEDLERKDFNGGSTAIHSQGSMHNFTLPLASDYGPCKKITNITVEIDAIAVDLSNLPPDCIPTPTPYYYNIALGCIDFIPASCPISDYLGEANTPTFTDQNLSYNGDFDFGENLTVDIVPVMNINCTEGQEALTLDNVILDYEICVTVTIEDEEIDVPVDITGEQTICPNSTTTLSVGSYTEYEWGPDGETTQTIDVDPGTYNVTVTDANGCTDTDQFVILSYPDSPITFDPVAPTVCDNGSVLVSVNESYSNYAWSNALNGQFVNLSTGTYDVTITDSNNCTAVNTISVVSIPIPNAGTDNSETLCDGDIIDLTTLLSGDADPGGVFSDPAATGSLTGSMVNTTGLAGQTIDFIYTVGLPTDQCGDDMATLTIIVESPLEAGDDNSETLCEGDNIDLTSLLSADADAGGVFSDPAATGSLTGSMVNTAGLGGQTVDYIYTVGLPADVCGEDQATLTLIVELALEAGDDNSTSVCDGDFFDLNDLLSVDADAGGVFSDPAATGSLTGSIVNTLGLGGQTFDFIYQVGDATDVCGTDDATLTLIIDPFLEAGDDNSATVCEGIIFNLNDLLSGDADFGGIFIDPASTGALTGAMVNTAGYAGQTLDFIYEVGDPTNTCGTDEATLTLIIESSVEAGDDNSTTACEGSTIDLFDLLDINASTGGMFSDPNATGALVGSLVNTTGFAGQTLDFIYQVGQPGDPCGSDEATLTVNVESSLLAGDDNSVELCIGETIDLNDYLVNADVGGNYEDINSCGGLNGNILDSNGLTPGQCIYEYIVGDGVTCPFDTAEITILFVDSPIATFEIDTIELCYDICQEINIAVTGGAPFMYDLAVNDQSGTSQASTTLTSSTNDFSIYLCNDQSQITFSNDTLNFGNLDSLLLTIDNVQSDACSSQIIDSLWITSLPQNIFQLDTSICIFDTLFIDDLEFFFGNSTYMDTIDGIECDSFININVSFDDVDTSYILETICAGDSTNYFSTWFTEANPYEEITIDAESGCDSLVIIDITFDAPVIAVLDLTLCEGDSIVVNGVTYNNLNTVGQETLIDASVNGCDSIVIINLEFDGINIVRSDTLCEGESIVIGGTLFDESNSPNQLIVPGIDCDTTFDINLTFIAPSINIIDGTFCANFDTIVNGVLYDFDNPSDVETIVGGSSLGCDSIITINLNFEAPAQNIIDGIYCSDFDTLVNGVLYNFDNPSDIETIIGGSYLGCDSIIGIDLNFYPVAQNTIDTTICANESFVINGVTYDQDNLFGTETIINQNGCDSTITITVSLYDIFEENQSFAICEGDSIFLMDAWQFSAGVFTDTFTTLNGCDSIITSTLTLMPCAVDVNVSSIGNNCVGGALGLIELEVISQISLPYSIVLEDLSSGSQTTINVSVEQNNYQFENLISGSYEVSIIENDGTVIYTTTEVINDLYDALTGSWNLIETIICNGELAQLEFVPTGGFPDYNYTWNSADLGNASIIDQVPSGAYSITVSDMNGCTFDSSFTIDQPSAITYELQTTNVSCIGLESGDITIENIQGGTSPYTVLIDNVITNDLYIDSLTVGQYTVEIIDDNGCSSISNQVNITGSSTDLLADYTLTHDIIEGESVLLDGELFENNLSFEWSPTSTLSCTNCIEPTASPSTTTNYEVIISNEDGCEQIINISVIVSPNVIMQVFPNIFSPNGDGSNDEFMLNFENELISKLELIVFDRWGNQMHNSTSTEGSIMWDGTSKGGDLNPGVYVYQLTIDYLDGTSESMVKDLTLIK